MFSDISISGRQKLFQNIQSIIQFRNALAHGQMNIYYEKKCASIIFFDKNENNIKTITLSKDIIKEYNKKISGTILFLFADM